jgi:sugar O-acyltransferase (sialic acid O-acetyltransferase NeuD family)
MMKKIIIFGTSDFAEVAHYYFTHDSSYEVVAFTANSENINEKLFHDLPVIPFENIKKLYPSNEFSMFIAVAYSEINKIRSKIFLEAKLKGYELVSYINSNAIVSKNCIIGENCFILENVVIQPFVKVGNNVVIWSGNHIGHHVTIGDHCFITSHVVISGNVIIEPYCFLGVNSTIRDGIKISRECVIGAGSVILKNTLPNQIYSNKSTTLLPFASDKLKHL